MSTPLGAEGKRCFHYFFCHAGERQAKAEQQKHPFPSSVVAAAAPYQNKKPPALKKSWIKGCHCSIGCIVFTSELIIISKQEQFPVQVQNSCCMVEILATNLLKRLLQCNQRNDLDKYGDKMCAK